MKLMIRLIGLFILLLPTALIASLFFMLDDTPMLQNRADLTPESVARGKRIFEQNDPRRLASGSVVNVRLDQNELDLAINYIANEFFGSVAGLKIDKERALVEGTLKLPSNPFGRYINLQLELNQAEGLPKIGHLTLGKLWIPGFVAEILINSALSHQQLITDWQTIGTMIKDVKFTPKSLTITYQWQNDLPAKLSNSLLSLQDHQSIEIYQRRLIELTAGGKKSYDLASLMQPLFQLASVRSSSGDALAENRALLLVLSFYVNKMGLDKIVLQAKNWATPEWRIITLNGRDDFPKHYLVSAMLAAFSGTPLADAVGLFKEIEDSHGGSGFSFNDIAADRAGTLMGQLAANNVAAAKKIQQLLASAQERDFMPETADLPEFMPEAEFKRRFGGIKGEPYKQMMKDIELRVAALPINRE